MTQMKFFFIIFLVILATAHAVDDCEYRAEICIDRFQRAVNGASTNEEVLKELGTSIRCLKKVVETCLGKSLEEAEDHLKELEKRLRMSSGGSQEATSPADDECEDRSEMCVDGIDSRVKSATSKEEVCMELRKSVDCLNNVVEDCFEDESNEVIEASLKRLNKDLAEYCGTSGKNEETASEVVYECMARAENCVGRVEKESEGASRKEVCKILTTSVDCLKNVVEDCLDDWFAKDIELRLRLLERNLKLSCERSEEVSEDDDDDITICLEENKEYIFKCMFIASAKSLEILGEEEDIDKNTLTCKLYKTAVSCFMERLTERCGEAASKIAPEVIKNIPREIKEACKSSGITETPDIIFMDKKE